MYFFSGAAEGVVDDEEEEDVVCPVALAISWDMMEAKSILDGWAGLRRGEGFKSGSGRFAGVTDCWLYVNVDDGALGR